MRGHARAHRLRNADELAMFNQAKQRDARRHGDRHQLRRDKWQYW